MQAIYSLNRPLPQLLPLGMFFIDRPPGTASTAEMMSS